MGYIAQVFSSLGFPIAEARWRAFLLYGYIVAESVMSRDVTATQREERNRFVEQLVQKKLPAEALSSATAPRRR